MKTFARFILLGLATSSMLGCQDWIDEARQQNYKQCTQACSSVFSSFPQHYTLCMNAGLQSDGYYNGPACQSYIAPHLYCLGAGYHFPKSSNSEQITATQTVSRVINKNSLISALPENNLSVTRN